MHINDAPASHAKPLYSARLKRAAFLVSPHAGGTFSVFTALRTALAQVDLPLEWIGLSQHPEQLSADPQFAHELRQGYLIDARGKNAPQLCAQLISIITQHHYDLVFINVLTSPAEMSVVAYLPPEIRRIMIVHNITPGTYAAAKAVAPYVHTIVGVSPRIQQDLIRKIHTPAASTLCVPNAMDLKPYANIVRTPRSPTFRLLSLGRIVDADKGVFWVPKILHRLADLPIHLTVAGDGPDLPALKRRCADLGDRVTFIGRIAAAGVPALAADNDAFLMPSRFEGFGYTLVESMAAGCVPVASRISGVTDFVVQENQNGLLFPIGNTAAAALCIRRLATDPQLLVRLSAAGPSAVRDRFSLDTLTAGYGSVLARLDEFPAPAASRQGQPITPLAIGGSWRKYIPLPLKNLLRNYLHR